MIKLKSIRMDSMGMSSCPISSCETYLTDYLLETTITLLLSDIYMYIDRKDAIKLPKDTYFIRDLIGIEVYTNDGEKLGIIDDIFKTGSNDVYVVRNSLGKQILLPAINDVIKEINIKDKKILVHLINGL